MKYGHGGSIYLPHRPYPGQSRVPAWHQSHLLTHTLRESWSFAWWDKVSWFWKLAHGVLCCLWTHALPFPSVLLRGTGSLREMHNTAPLSAFREVKTWYWPDSGKCCSFGVELNHSPLFCSCYWRSIPLVRLLSWIIFFKELCMNAHNLWVVGHEITQISEYPWGPRYREVRESLGGQRQGRRRPGACLEVRPRLRVPREAQSATVTTPGESWNPVSWTSLLAHQAVTSTMEQN